MVKRIFQFGLLAVIVLAVWQSQALADWWQLRNYQPNAQIASIAKKVDFTDAGRDLFYINEPELNDKESFNRNCPSADRANVLGCYISTGLFNQGRIYLLGVDRQELAGVEEVTAAHEVLHAAYERLSTNERESVNEMLAADFDKYAPQELRQKIDLYNDDPHLRLNEMHSFLGTEVEQLSPELEEHYSRYFDDRTQVVALFKQYEEVFAAIEAKTARLEAEITQLKADIENLRARIESTRAELEAVRSQMDTFRANGQTEQYNALVPEHNQLLAEHNSLVNQHNNKVSLHNAKADELNKLALRHNELAESLDSQQAE